MKMNSLETKRYNTPFILSLLIHMAIICLAIISFVWTSNFKPALLHPNPQQPIQATAINTSEVQHEIARLKAQQQQKEQAELVKQQKLAAAAKAAELARLREQQKLVALKAQQRRAHEQLLAQQKAEAEKLVQLKKQREAEQQRLQKLAEQRKAAETKAKQAKAAEAKAKQAKAAETKTAASKAEQAKAKKAQELKKKQLAQEQIQEQLENEEQQLAAMHAKQTNNVVEHYMSLIQNSIENNWNKPEAADPNAKCKLLVKVAPGGTVLSVVISKSSGDSALDQSAINAVYKAQPLPVPNDSDIFDQYFRQFIITT